MIWIKYEIIGIVTTLGCFDTISAIPDILYWLPEKVGKHDCLVLSTTAKIAEVEHHCHIEEEENMYTEYFTAIVEELGFNLQQMKRKQYNYLRH